MEVSINLNRKGIRRKKSENGYSLRTRTLCINQLDEDFPDVKWSCNGIDHQWQADLVDLGKLASYNKGFKYLLTCIDVLSRYAWVVPLTDKTGKTLKEAFEVIFKLGRQPIRLQQIVEPSLQSVSEISEGKQCSFLYHV